MSDNDVKLITVLMIWITEGVAAHDYLLGAGTAGGDHAAQADGSVADHGHALAGADLGGESRVVAGGRA